MPPPITDAIDWALARTPFASTLTSTPLEFQNRESSVTSRSFGASMKTRTASVSRSGSSSWPTTRPTRARR